MPHQLIGHEVALCVGLLPLGGVMATTVTALPSPAKVNLFLAVIGKRPTGYHELVTLMCPITLADTVKLELTHQDISVACANPQVPEDNTNLAYQAAWLFRDHWVREKAGASFGVHITIEKQIPVAAGLGGGSSNAATVLLALNGLCQEPYTTPELAAMASKLGADVPFFIFRQPAIGTGIGDTLAPVADVLRGYTIILVHPPLQISTATVYQNLNLRLTKCQQRLTKSNLCIEDVLQCIQTNKIEKCLCNDLETVTAVTYPEVERIKQTLLAYGADGALMSGSGPTVFGLFKNDTLAAKVFQRLAAAYPWRIFLAARWVHEKGT